ncbi:hypothetical protein RhiirC2_774112 [Rhizophagus irregularis]|uniref:FLYWCH-type domain-containing protein n=1 Tax=Rhizophagus irregularis TaxID=588596 RepID=A0A2N1NMD2_9GLOM|nr:hypothetical protein RhiirC2_774112 [Rhizophagus irregularis]
MNRVVCDLVNSTQSNPKIIVLVKDRNRNEKHYWCCKYRKKLKCNRRAVTILDILAKSSERNHALEANRVDVTRKVNMKWNCYSESTQFPPELWSVYELIENEYPRTQNNIMVEGWHQRWSTVIERLYSIIDEMRKEALPNRQTELQIENILPIKKFWKNSDK